MENIAVLKNSLITFFCEHYAHVKQSIAGFFPNDFAVHFAGGLLIAVFFLGVIHFCDNMKRYYFAFYPVFSVAFLIEAVDFCLVTNITNEILNNSLGDFYFTVLPLCIFYYFLSFTSTSIWGSKVSQTDFSAKSVSGAKNFTVQVSGDVCDFHIDVRLT